MEKRQNNKFLYISVCAANLTSFSCGLAFTWTSPVIPKLNGNIDPSDNPLPNSITPSEESWITSLLYLGAAIGPFLCSYTSDKFGRKKTLLAFSLPVLVAFIIKAFANNVTYYYVARFVLGFGLGSVFSVLPMYVGEIAQNHNRGMFGLFLTIFVTVGILTSYVIGPYLTIKTFSLVCAVPTLIFIPVFTLTSPESPHYLVAQKKYDLALKSLERIRTKSLEDIQKELDEIKLIVENSNKNKYSLGSIFTSKPLIKGLVIILGLMFFQQFSGINAILSYLQSIFEATGSSIPSDVSTIATGLIQFLFCCLASGIVEKFGRRTLLVVSSTGMFLSQIALGTYFYLKAVDFDLAFLFWLPVLSLITFISSYTLGLCGLPWAIMGEIFPSEHKSTASAICTFFCLMLAFTTTLCFPYLVEAIGISFSFYIFATFCCLSLVFVVFVVPETKGKSLSEIQQMLVVNKAKKVECQVIIGVFIEKIVFKTI